MKYLKSIFEFLEIQIENENVGYVKPSIENDLTIEEIEEIEDNSKDSTDN